MTVEIQDVDGASGGGGTGDNSHGRKGPRDRPTHTLSWYKRLQRKAANMSGGATSGALYQGNFDRLLAGYRKYITLPIT